MGLGLGLGAVLGFVLGSGVGVGLGLGFERVGEVPSLSRVEVRTAALHEPHPKGQHLHDEARAVECLATWLGLGLGLGLGLVGINPNPNQVECATVRTPLVPADEDLCLHVPMHLEGVARREHAGGEE